MKWVVISVGGLVALGLVASLLIWVSGLSHDALAEATAVPSTSTTLSNRDVTTTTEPAAPSTTSSTTTTTTTVAPATTTSTSTTLPAPEDLSIGERRFFSEFGLGYLADAYVGFMPSEAEGKLWKQLLAAGYVLIATESTPQIREQLVESMRAGGGADFIPILEGASRHLDPQWTDGVLHNCFAGDPLIFLNSDPIVGSVLTYDAGDFDSVDGMIDFCVVQTVHRNHSDASWAWWFAKWEKDFN